MHTRCTCGVKIVLLHFLGRDRINTSWLKLLSPHTPADVYAFHTRTVGERPRRHRAAAGWSSVGFFVVRSSPRQHPAYYSYYLLTEQKPVRHRPRGVRLFNHNGEEVERESADSAQMEMSGEAVLNDARSASSPLKITSQLLTWDNWVQPAECNPCYWKSVCVCVCVCVDVFLLFHYWQIGH